MDLIKLQTDPAAFRRCLLIDTDQGPQPFAQVMDPWQKADFAALDGGWRKAIGQQAEGPSRAWLERPRGHAKSSDVMVMAAWALFASRKQLSGAVTAVDRDQAALDRDHVGRLLSLNPWLSDVLEVQQWRIINKHTGSTLEIMASDVASSYGLLLDFAVCDEVSLWPKPDLFHSILSAAAKRSTCLLLCIGNAGFADSWVWSLRESIRQDPAWYFSRLDGPIASWITTENLAEQKRLLPPTAYSRLWENVWSSAAGDAIAPELIQRAFLPHLQPQQAAQPGFTYIAGLDIGVTRDASALCVLGVHRGPLDHGRIRLAATRVWRPTKLGKVNLQDVEDCVRDLHRRFGFRQVNYDPWEARHMASRLQSVGVGRLVPRTTNKALVPLVEVPPTGKHLQAIATAVIEAFNDCRVELYEEPDLHRDLNRLRVVERSYGFRLESPRDELGHGDLGTAFSLAMLAAGDLASRKQAVMGVVRSQPRSPFASAERECARRLREQEMMQPPSAGDNEFFRDFIRRASGGARGYR